MAEYKPPLGQTTKDFSVPMTMASDQPPIATGGFPPGLKARGARLTTVLDASLVANIYGVIGLKQESLGTDTITVISLSISELTGLAFDWFLLKNPTVAGTPVFAAETDSVVEIARGATANTVTGGTYLYVGNRPENGGGGDPIPIPSSVKLSNDTDEIWLCVQAQGDDAEFLGSKNWSEPE